MASSLRAQYSQQFVQDMNTFDNAVQKAETYYNNAQMSQVQTKANQVYFDYQQEIKQTDDFTQYEAIQSKYQAQIDDYLNEIKASPKVRKQWYENYQPEMDLNMQKFRADSEVKGMYTKAELGWEGYVDVVGSDTSMTLDQKISALVEYHTKNQVESIPETIVGQKLSIDEAKTQMVYASAQQGVTNYYANKDNNINAVDFNKDAVFQYVISELTDAEGNSYVTENEKANVNTIIQNQIDKMEEQAKAQAKTNQENFSTYYTELRNKGQNLNDEDIVMMASQYGAYNPDGSINRFWAPWFEGYANTVEAINDFNAIKDVDFTVDTTDEYIKSFKGQGAYYDNSTATFKFDGVEVSTPYGGIVNAIFDHYGINTKSENAVRKVVDAVNNLGAEEFFIDKDLSADIAEISYFVSNPLTTGEECEALLTQYKIRYGADFEQVLKNNGLDISTIKAFKTTLNANGLVAKYIQNDIKYDSTKNESIKKYAGILKYLEYQFNVDSSILDINSPKFAKALEQAKQAYNTDALNKTLNNAYTYIGLNDTAIQNSSKALFDSFGEALFGAGILENEAITGDVNLADNYQKLMAPFYNTDNESHWLYSIMLPDSYYAQLTQDIFNSKEIKEDYTDQKMLDVASNSLFGMSWNEIGETEKTSVLMGVVRYAYEQDFEDNIIDGYKLNRENISRIYVGDCSFAVYDHDTNTWYMPPTATSSKGWYRQGTGSPNVSSQIKNGKLTFTLDEINYTTAQPVKVKEANKGGFFNSVVSEIKKLYQGKSELVDKAKAFNKKTTISNEVFNGTENK